LSVRHKSDIIKEYNNNKRDVQSGGTGTSLFVCLYSCLFACCLNIFAAGKQIIKPVLRYSALQVLIKSAIVSLASVLNVPFC